MNMKRNKTPMKKSRNLFVMTKTNFGVKSSKENAKKAKIFEVLVKLHVDFVIQVMDKKLVKNNNS